MVVVLSGLDGAGKTTLARLLSERFHDHGFRTFYFWSRGGYTPILDKFKRIVRRVGRSAVPPPGRNANRTRALAHPVVRWCWLTAAMLDLLIMYAVVIRWHRARGTVVICDRYLADTLIDFRLNLCAENIERTILWRMLETLAVRPDGAFVLTVPVEVSLRRSEEKAEPFPDTGEVLQLRLDQYRELTRDPRWRHISGCEPLEENLNTVWQWLIDNARRPALRNAVKAS